MGFWGFVVVVVVVNPPQSDTSLVGREEKLEKNKSGFTKS